MAASAATSDGVPSAQGGGIFEGIKFWVSHKVPQRAILLEHITSNGGVVEPREAASDMLIADCARKNVLPDSYSWKFIVDSVQNGCIQLRDRYRIGADSSTPRPQQSANRARTAFTTEDDIVLARWVLQHSAGLQGNAIYKDLASVNSRHTWQSWRNRYSKTLMARGPDALQKLAAKELPEGHNDESGGTPRADQGTSSRAKASTVPVDQDETPRPVSPRASLSKSARHAARTPNRASSTGKELDDDPNSPKTDGSDGSLEEMEKFYCDFSDFWNVHESKPIDLIEIEYNIGGKMLGLWDLSMAAYRQKRPFALLDAADWSSIAKDLGYDPSQEPRIVLELWQCFDNNLAKFLEHMDDQEAPRDDADAADAASESVLSPQSRQGPENMLPSSPPVTLVAGKRRSLSDEPSPSQRSAKRRRGTSDEIPATPEDKLRSEDRLQARRTQSPSLPGNVPATVEQVRRAQGPHETPPPSMARRASGRPGPTGDDAAQLVASEDLPQCQDVSPSQQLRSECHCAAPNPRSDVGPEQATEAFPGHSTDFPSSPVASQATPKAPRRLLPTHFGARAPERLADESGGPRQQPQAPSAAASQDPPRQGPKGRISEIVKSYQALGYSREIVVKALKHTSLRPGGNVNLVMQRLKDGQGVPNEYEGIWTDKDDQYLQMADQVIADGEPEGSKKTIKANKRLAWLTLKHGGEGVTLRRRILADLAEWTAEASGDKSLQDSL